MSIMESIVERWRERREQAAVLRALEFMGPEQAQILAADVNLSLDELKQVLGKGALANRLLDRMLKARGLEAAAIDVATMREIESTCSRCECKSLCRHELDAGTAKLHAAGFCPNDQLMSLLEQRAAA